MPLYCNYQTLFSQQIRIFIGPSFLTLPMFITKKLPSFVAQTDSPIHKGSNVACYKILQ